MNLLFIILGEKYLSKLIYGLGFGTEKFIGLERSVKITVLISLFELHMKFDQV